MKTKLLISTFLGMAAWSLSNIALAGWEEGPCPQPHVGPAPCIEVLDNNDVYWHFNGTGGHAGEWHGHPLGGDFSFSNDDVDLGCSLASLNCTLALQGQVKKCQDSNGNWRFGVKVTGGSASDGLFCGTVNLYNFPWFAKDAANSNHCPFEDDCDDFVRYVPSASSYKANFGAVSVDALFMNLVDKEHLHNVEFHPGLGAYFDFSSKTFYDCSENPGCGLNGELQLDNAKALFVY